MTPEEAKGILLGLADVGHKPHFDRTAFHTPRKIFATMSGNETDVNFMFDAAHQEHYCEMAPEAFAPVSGGWGRMGATRCDLSKVDAATFASAAAAAHRLAAPKPTKRAK